MRDYKLSCKSTIDDGELRLADDRILVVSADGEVEKVIFLAHVSAVSYNPWLEIEVGGFTHRLSGYDSEQLTELYIEAFVD